VSEVNPRRLAQVNISRVKHNEKVSAAMSKTPIHTGDLVMAVGLEEELDKLRILLGEETNERILLAIPRNF
jgi:putative transport protein